jgi:hypothetical protein
VIKEALWRYVTPVPTAMQRMNPNTPADGVFDVPLREVPFAEVIER